MKIKTKSKKVNKAWLNDHVNDPYVKLAQKEGYRARAAYKLKEIDESLGLVKPGMVILDLGSAPGAWSQYLRRRLTALKATDGQSDGRLIAVDLLHMEPIDGVTFIQGDLSQPEVRSRLHQSLAGCPIDLLVSDMAPNLSGIESADSARIEYLLELAFELAHTHLKPQGVLLAKLFHGSGYSQWVKQFKQQFKIIKPIKPKASRDRSAETFMVGIGMKERLRPYIS